MSAEKPNSKIQFVQVLTTTDSPEVAQQIGERLIDSAAAACVQIEGPVTSIYQWNQKVETSQEYRVTIKTVAAKEDAVTAIIEANHTYDTPQIVVVPITGGSKAYLDWVAEQTQ